MTFCSIMLAISGRDILRPLGIWFRPFTDNVRDTKYHKWCSRNVVPTNVRQEPKANTNVAYKICDLAYKFWKCRTKSLWTI